MKTTKSSKLERHDKEAKSNGNIKIITEKKQL